MAKKKADQVEVPATYEAADALLEEHGDLTRQLAKQEARLAEKVAKLTALIERTATPLRDRLTIVSAQIEAYAKANRARLTESGKVKFHDMPAGRIGWRTNPASIEWKNGFKVADVVASILKMKLRRKFLRMKLEPNKEAMLEDQDKALTVPGVRVAQAERFYIEPKGAKLSEGAP